jgi:hypothetical protein
VSAPALQSTVASATDSQSEVEPSAARRLPGSVSAMIALERALRPQDGGDRGEVAEAIDATTIAGEGRPADGYAAYLGSLGVAGPIGPHTTKGHARFG